MAHAMETKVLKDLVSILMSDTRHEIAKLEMPEESWDSLLDLIASFEHKLVGIYDVVRGED
jgi:hypothetical protein